MLQPRVCIFGGSFDEKQIEELKKHIEPHFYPDDTYIFQAITFIQPDIMVSIGTKGVGEFPKMCRMNIIDKNRWLHFNKSSDIVGGHGAAAMRHCFVNDAATSLVNHKLISVFTTSYKSRHYIQRVYKSLLQQTHQMWEWVIFDDTDGDENWKNLVALKNKDPKRIRIYRTDGNSGVIGNVKQLASSLCRGTLLVEMDHDDEFTPQALELLYKASLDFPEAGFFYSDFSEITEKCGNLMYPEGFCIGFGSYRQVYQPEKKRWIFVVASSPINYMNMRWLVGCPNHYRAWRKKTLEEIGGWNHRFHVADDFDVMIRTFLHTKMVRVPCLGYYQYRNDGGDNYTFIRNRQIQELGFSMTRYWNEKISKRFVELTGQDPHKHDWNNTWQFKPYWENPDVFTSVHGTYRIRGRTEGVPLVSAVWVSEGNRQELQQGLEKIYQLSLQYSEMEVMVVGNACQTLELFIADICANKVPSINPDWVRKNLSFWSIKKTSYASCLNYATKMINVGQMTLVLRQNDLENLPDNFVKIGVEKLIQEPNLDYVTCGQKIIYQHEAEEAEGEAEEETEDAQDDEDNEDAQWDFKLGQHILHRSDLYLKHGFWRKHENLVDIWEQKSIKSVDLNESTLEPLVVCAHCDEVHADEEEVEEEKEEEKEEIEEEMILKSDSVDDMNVFKDVGQITTDVEEVNNTKDQGQILKFGDDDEKKDTSENENEKEEAEKDKIFYFIINHDRASVLEKEIDSLRMHADDIEQVVIVDHNSTYQGTLDYYRSLRDDPWVWIEGIRDEYFQMSPVPDHINLARVGYQHLIDVVRKYQHQYRFKYFAKCDPDCEIPQIPGYFSKLIQICQKFKNRYQIGPCPRTDDIPDAYPMKNDILINEARFFGPLFEKNIKMTFQGETQEETIKALVPSVIDGTLSIYPVATFLHKLEPDFCNLKKFPAIRVAEPKSFQLRHLDWYITEPDQEVLYARKTGGLAASHATNWMIGVNELIV